MTPAGPRGCLIGPVSAEIGTHYLKVLFALKKNKKKKNANIK